MSSQPTKTDLSTKTLDHPYKLRPTHTNQESIKNRERIIRIKNDIHEILTSKDNEVDKIL